MMLGTDQSKEDIFSKVRLGRQDQVTNFYVYTDKHQENQNS